MILSYKENPEYLIFKNKIIIAVVISEKNGGNKPLDNLRPIC